MAFKDKVKRRAYDRKWSRENRSRRLELNNAWRNKVIAWYEGYKQTLKCELCPESESCCLDFHHKDPEQKDLAVAEAVRNGWSIKRLKTEIAKCAVLCANCHRKVHAGIAQLVEHRSCKAKVASSKLVPSSTNSHD